jgi:succinate-semialdehyde dehydrogenase/glutarate-semialdehyde dehydrogenase
MSQRGPIKTSNPATGEVLASYPELTDAELEAKVAAATRVFPAWRDLGFARRAELMVAAARVLRADAAPLGRLISLEMGKPIKEARAEVEKCAWVCEWYAEQAERLLAPEPASTDAKKSYVRFDPLGPVLAVMPWNFPFWQVFRFAAPGLMAGNVGLLKHAETSTGAGLAIEEVFRKAGFPEAVFTALPLRRDRIDGLIRDRRIVGVSLTGSVEAGRAVGRAAGEALKPCVLELGGSDPFVVLRDADLDRSLAGAIAGRMINSGQSCIASKRFIVEAPLYDAFVEGFTERIGALVVGDPLSELTQIGPLARADFVAPLHAQVLGSVKAGARLTTGGNRIGPQAGAFYAPTLLADVTPGMPAFDEETFGPVAAVTRARDADEAIALANQTVFGLGASVWTDAARGDELARRIAAGHVAVNGTVRSDPRLPFGGIKDSGLGRELGRYGILAFVNIKAVWIGV